MNVLHVLSSLKISPVRSIDPRVTRDSVLDSTIREERDSRRKSKLGEGAVMPVKDQEDERLPKTMCLNWTTAPMHVPKNPTLRAIDTNGESVSRAKSTYQVAVSADHPFWIIH